MKKYRKNLILALVCFLIVIVLNFFLPRLLPGNPIAYLPVFVQLRPADLPVHLAQGRRRDGWVVPRAGQPCRQLRVGVFVVRQIDVDQALQLPQRLNRFIAAAVVDDGHGKPRRQRREDGRQKVRRRDEIDVLTALVD